MSQPSATYRLQLTPGFGFAEAQALVPYLSFLGISDLYLSPVLAACQGSLHGYDGVDPAVVNPGLGGEAAFIALAQTLKTAGMGLLVDIVPNHLAASDQNPWWWDVLKHGPASPYASFFDVDWEPERPERHHTILLPILARPFGEALEAGDIRLTARKETLALTYLGTALPLSDQSLRYLWSVWHQQRSDQQESEDLPPILIKPELWPPSRLDPRQILMGMSSSPTAESWITWAISRVNGQPGQPSSWDLMENLLDQQPYRLAHWSVANTEGQYRRFFDVNGLIALRMEQASVFEATHAKILDLAKSGWITGFRVDHIDGLGDPRAYLHRLQQALPLRDPRKSPGFYLVVEKILAAGESLPADWPVAGTTGYDFLNALNGLGIDRMGLRQLRRHATAPPFAQAAYEAKRVVMRDLLAADLRRLVRHLASLANHDRYGHDLTQQELGETIAAVSAALPVYRTYIQKGCYSSSDKAVITRALAQAQEILGPTPALRFVARVLLESRPGEPKAHDSLSWIQRWQQFTGPVTAKGVEDTALYRDAGLISLDEVGQDPEQPPGLRDFHRFNQRRAARWPWSMNASSTHDAKRSEDVRARLNVLSELSASWQSAVDGWHAYTAAYRLRWHGQPVPDWRVETRFYQMLAGLWPLDEHHRPDLADRIAPLMIKAEREAKIHTDWQSPAGGYEQCLDHFIRAALTPDPQNLFLADFAHWIRPLTFWGAMAALSQTLLKIAAPGVPDFYQGTELWNFQLVDPDNRHPVDFSHRQSLLGTLRDDLIQNPSSLVDNTVAHWTDGRVKLLVILLGLQYRKTHPRLFAEGTYIPLHANHLHARHLTAFARRWQQTWAIVAAPRLTVQLSATLGHDPLTPPYDWANRGGILWHHASLTLPSDAPRLWRNHLTGDMAETEGPNPEHPSARALPLSSDLRRFPVALWTSVT